MSQDNFLQSIARYFSENAPGRPEAENIVYVLPNKRSAMFLKKYVREQVCGVALMPRFMTMRNFVSIYAHRPEVPEREALFILYEAYRRTLMAKGRAETVREFDSFIFWGDMMLSDFDDIDRSLVNADDLFKNLRNIKEIQANYLDDEQKEVIRRVWGESRLTSGIDDFWLHVGDDTVGDSLASKFVYLWEILADVYHLFHELLHERGLESIGGQYRSALKQILSITSGEVPDDEHYVFVGFNDLTTVETLIFNHLKSIGAASFFWDIAPLRLCPTDSEVAIPLPLRRLRELVRNFPMPDDYTVPVPDYLPDVRITAVPSNIGQAKALGPLLSRWSDDGHIDTDNPLNTAIVLPDRGLLLPTLLTIPEDIKAVNISMGLSYRTTTFAALLHSIVSMQLRARDIHGVTHFYFEDVNAILAHPHIQLIAREDVDHISTFVTERKLYNVSAVEIVDVAPDLKAVFTPVSDMSRVSDVAAYLLNLFDWLTVHLETVGEHTFEIDAVKYFREEVEDLAALIERYGVTMTDRTFLHLFERIFNARGLTVNGTPLEGLQVLGVLETRGLDFDNIAILSMNERVFPRKQYTKTMIPNSLRSGFGLPDFENLEWTYAYCFYRLLARARRVALFYDSRSAGVGNGEMSRYISQLRYLMPQISSSFESVNYVSQGDTNTVISIKKTPDILKSLDEFRKGGSLRLSASALKTYKSCPMRFYLEYARRMRGSDELVDYITSSEFGTVVHNTIQKLYGEYEGELIDVNVINRWLDPANSAIDDAAREMIIRERYPKAKDPENVVLSAEAELAVQLVARIARANLEAERNFYCANGQSFTFIANEKKIDGVWHIDDELDVNFYMSIDRVDRIDGNKLRFIDFKTGDDEISAKNIGSLFNTTIQEKDGIFQLFTYCEAYGAMVDPNIDIQPVIHCMRKLSSGVSLSPISLDGTPVESYAPHREVFKPLLHNFIKEIFDPNVDIVQCSSIDNCTYCAFQSLCGRIVKQR